MKRFVIYLIYMLLIVITGMTCLEIGYTFTFSNSTPRNKIDKAISLNGEHIDYLFLGSSRVENHIDCELVEKLTGKTCLNLGTQAGKLYDAITLLEILKQQGTTYNTLFLQIDYNYNIHTYSPLFKSQIAPFIEVGAGDLFTTLDTSFSGYMTVPFYRYMKNDKITGIRNLITRMLDKKIALDLDNGFVPLQGVGKNLSGKYPETLQEDPKIKNALEKYKDKMILYSAPYCKDALNRDSYIKKLKFVIPELEDYSNLFDNAEQNFSNCGHLNNKGALLFTEYIVNNLLLNN